MTTEIVKRSTTGNVEVNGSEYVTSWIAARLSRMGFEVKRKYIIEGEGGVHHELDILATLSPIPGLMIRIGFVVHKEVLTVNDVEKYIAWRNELPLDKIALIVIGDIEPDAYELAKHYGIDVIRPVEELRIDLEKVKGYKLYREEYIEPRVSAREALELLQRARHSILRRHRKVTACVLVYLPIIVIEAQISEKDPLKTETRLVNVNLAFDGVQGYLIIREGDTIGVEEVLGRFSDLSDEAIHILRVISEEGTATLNDIEEVVGVLGEKLRAILGRLAEKSLVDLFGDMAEIRYSILSKSFDPRKTAKLVGAKIREGVLEKKEGVLILQPKTYISRFIELVEAINGHIDRISVVYYPLYVGLLEENNGKSQKLVIIDGLTGAEARSLYRILSEIETLRAIESESISIDKSSQRRR